MSRFSGPPRGLEPFVEILHRVIYGPGYRRARKEAFARSRGICQYCGRRRATEAHHWSLRYPTDDEITANDLTALCRRCHQGATFRRLLDRVGCAGVWMILATALERRRPRAACGDRIAGGRRCATRRRSRSCRAPEQAPVAHPAPASPEPDLRTLVLRCGLTLVAGCLACDRFVRLDAVARFRRHGWSGSIADLRRQLCCCRCRSRTRWVLLASWPAGDASASDRPPRLSFGDTRDRG